MNHEIRTFKRNFIDGRSVCGDDFDGAGATRNVDVEQKHVALHEHESTYHSNSDRRQQRFCDGGAVARLNE